MQHHISSAVAYNVWHYYQVTGDIDFLSFYGAEMLIEIARFWASLAQHNRSLDRCEICGVVGPDEFHDAYPDADEPDIDNNACTNIMAVWVLCCTLEAIELLPVDRRKALRDRLGSSQEELKRWENVSRRMRIVFHGDGVIRQFEGYDKLKEFDWEGYRKKYGDVQRCYMGIETRQNVLWLNPSLPREPRELRFAISYRRQRVDLHVTRNRLIVST